MLTYYNNLLIHTYTIFELINPIVLLLLFKLQTCVSFRGPVQSIAPLGY